MRMRYICCCCYRLGYNDDYHDDTYMLFLLWIMYYNEYDEVLWCCGAGAMPALCAMVIIIDVDDGEIVPFITIVFVTTMITYKQKWIMIHTK